MPCPEGTPGSGAAAGCPDVVGAVPSWPGRWGGLWIETEQPSLCLCLHLSVCVLVTAVCTEPASMGLSLHSSPLLHSFMLISVHLFIHPSAYVACPPSVLNESSICWSCSYLSSSIDLSVCPSSCSCLLPSIHPSVCLYRSIHPSVCLSVHLLLRPSCVCLSLATCIDPSIHLFICLLHPSIPPSVPPS